MRTSQEEMRAGQKGSVNCMGELITRRILKTVIQGMEESSCFGQEQLMSAKAR